MIDLRGRGGRGADPMAAARAAYGGAVMAAVLALPGLCVFVAVHQATGSVLAGALPGFGLHFATLAFSGRIASRVEAALR